MTQLSITPEQQLELEKIKREIQKISDLALLRSEYLYLAQLNMEMRNTCIHLIGQHWGISKPETDNLSIDFAIRIAEETNEDTNQNSN